LAPETALRCFSASYGQTIKSRMQGKITSERAGTAVYAGIGVCKAWLDPRSSLVRAGGKAVYLHPTGQSFRVANNKEGINMREQDEAGKARRVFGRGGEADVPPLALAVARLA
jgi:hypothetical protein